MPLSQNQIDAIGKMSDGAAILETIEADISAAVSSAIFPLDKKIKELTRETMSHKAAARTFSQQITELGLDPTKPLKDQIDALQENVKKQAIEGTAPSAELTKMQKRLEAAEKAIADSNAEKAQLQAQNKRERASSHFAPTLNEHFGKASGLLLENLLNKGTITVDDENRPGLKNEDGDFVTGDAAVALLKKMYPDLVVVKQRPGSGGTGASGGSSNNSGAKTVSRAEFESWSFEKKNDFFLKDKGVIEG